MELAIKRLRKGRNLFNKHYLAYSLCSSHNKKQHEKKIDTYIKRAQKLQWFLMEEHNTLIKKESYEYLKVNKLNY
jgi:hypothetical protein